MEHVVVARTGRTLGVCLFTLLVSAARADLTWEKKSIAIDARPGQKLTRTTYPFANHGPKPVRILAIQPSCGCVATALEKFDYAPGESGAIAVTFDLEMDNEPVQKRTIAVTTSDAPDTPLVLKLEARIPQIVEASPRTIAWEHGEKNAGKEIVVTIAAGQEMNLVEPHANSSDFAIEIRPEVKGQRYRVKITPKTTATPCSAEIHLQAEPAAGQSQELLVYASVK